MGYFLPKKSIRKEICDTLRIYLYLFSHIRKRNSGEQENVGAQPGIFDGCTSFTEKNLSFIKIAHANAIPLFL